MKHRFLSLLQTFPYIAAVEARLGNAVRVCICSIFIGLGIVCVLNREIRLLGEHLGSLVFVAKISLDRQLSQVFEEVVAQFHFVQRSIPFRTMPTGFDAICDTGLDFPAEDMPCVVGPCYAPEWIVSSRVAFVNSINR